MLPEKVTASALPYLRYVPEGQDYPLLLFLHGSGERGGDLEHVGNHGLPEILPHLPEKTLVLAPQCPEGLRWTDHLPHLSALLDETVTRYPVDPSRIYLTGLSMGGQGTWHLAAAQPERFAAAVPICGRSNPSAASRLKDLPLWVFHGDDDDVVPLSESEKMVAALRAVESEVKLTVFPGVGHDSWALAYTMSDMYSWLFSQVKR